MLKILPLLLTLTVQANSYPNNNNSPQPGWGLWQRKAEIEKAGFDAGFSNIELGGYLDFQNACQTATGLPEEQIDYWFRLSNSVNRMGTGQVEYGCWKDGRFLTTFTITAIKTEIKNPNCLRVQTRNKKGLIIRKEASANSRRLGVVRNGQIVKTDSFPANILEENGENWVQIVSPIKGWVSDGSFAGSGNLKLCAL